MKDIRPKTFFIILRQRTNTFCNSFFYKISIIAFFNAYFVFLFKDYIHINDFPRI